MSALSLAERIAQGRQILAEMAADDPRRARAEQRLAAWETELATMEPPLEQRYPWRIRWAREKGVLEVRDVYDGRWHQIEASQCPDSWRHEATRTSREERARRGGLRFTPPPPGEADAHECARRRAA